MSIIQDPINGTGARVDKKGRVQGFAVSSSEQNEASTSGDAYNLNTGSIILTDANETPLFYLRNNQDIDIKVPRIFVATAQSAGGAGEIEARVIKNLTGGTILSGTEIELTNFNFGSGKDVTADARLGGTGVTAVGESTNIEFLFPSDQRRDLVPFDTIVLPRGASMALLLTPPASNTSLKLQAGVNMFLDQSKLDE